MTTSMIIPYASLWSAFQYRPSFFMDHLFDVKKRGRVNIYHINPNAYAEGDLSVIQKSRVRRYVGSEMINQSECMITSIPISIPISLRRGIRAFATPRSSTLAKIGIQSITQSTNIAFSPLSFIPFCTNKNPIDTDESRSKIYLIEILYFFIFFSRGRRRLFTDTIMVYVFLNEYSL